MKKLASKLLQIITAVMETFPAPPPQYEIRGGHVPPRLTPAPPPTKSLEERIESFTENEWKDAKKRNKKQKSLNNILRKISFLKSKKPSKKRTIEFCISELEATAKELEHDSKFSELHSTLTLSATVLKGLK